jgi:ubiquinone/menaquinone biosynthesis C-methylase UbiE
VHDDLRRDYDAVAGEYARRISGELEGKPLDRALLEVFAEQVRAHGPVADLGCGPGHVGGWLAARGLEVTGVDLSPALLEEGRRRFPAVRFTEGDLLALPLPDASLAGAVAFYSLIHLAPGEWPRALAEAWRVLRPGGRLLLAVHVGAGTIHLDEWWGVAVSVDFHLLDPAWVAGQLEAAGFTVEATTRRAPYPEVEHPSERAYLLARRG